MKVLFIISTQKHISGGHYYSLKTIADALVEKIDVAICVIGLNESLILKNLKYKTVFFPFYGLNYLNVYKNLIYLCKEFRPEIIHTFDNNCLSFARLASIKFSVPLLYTKCGGPNPKRFFSFVEYLILFHKENEAFFRNSSIFNKLKIFCIPNRVNPIVSDKKRITKLKKAFNGKFTFIRISRIGNHHEESLIQSINLVKSLCAEKILVSLLIIGYVEDINILQKLQDLAKGHHVVFVTDEYYTINACDLIDMADFMIGSGRGLMEAASLGKILLAPLNKSSFPVLVQPCNFHELFYYNFSNRSILENYSAAENLALIKELLINKEKRDEFEKNSKTYFNDYFNVRSAIVNYIKIYSEVKYIRARHLVDFIKSVYLTIKTNIYWQLH